MNTNPPRTTTLFTLFFLSGAAGLACQVIWARLFANGLGHEIAAIVGVVTGFFGGLALGAWSSEKWIAQSLRPGRWYAVLELVIGLWSLLLIVLIPLANELVVTLAGAEGSSWQRWTLTLLVPLIVLLPATAAMGATWPAMEKFAAPSTRDKRVVGALYAANTGGALVGLLTAAFVLMPELGLSTTALCFAVINLACGAVAWWLQRGTEAPRTAVQSKPLGVSDPGQSSPEQVGPKQISQQKPKAPNSRAQAEPPAHFPSTRRLSLLLALTGLLGIGYEVVAIRVLSRVLESTIYTFAGALAVYLLGTALGAFVYQRALRSQAFPRLVSWLLLGASMACALGVVALALAREMYQFLRLRLGDSLWGGVSAEMIVAATVFLAPTLVMGAVFALLVQSARPTPGKTTRASSEPLPPAGALGVGRATALNTLGGAIAPALFGLVLLPVAGAKWTLLLIVAGYAALAWRPGVIWWAATILVPAFLAFLLPARLQGPTAPPGGSVVSYREGLTDSVAVLRHADGHRSLLVNNRFLMGGTGAAAAEWRHSHLPLLIHPSPTNALFLGVGTGISFSACGMHQNVRAEGVELVPEIVQAMNHFQPENQFPPDGRLSVRVADARRFARGTNTRYDVIIADLFHPARDGAGSLYTREHFTTLRDRLAPGGLVCQWLPLYQLDEAMLRIITRTFLEVFPHSSAWLLRFNVDTPVLGLVGSATPVRLRVDHFETRTQSGLAEGTLERAQLRDKFQFFGCFLAGDAELREWAGRGKLNTDDHPVVTFGAPSFQYQQRATTYGRLLTLLDHFPADPPAELFADAPSSELKAEIRREIAQFTASRNVYLRGLVSEAEGRSNEALDRFVESARLSPHFTTGYARCLTLATQRMRSDPASARDLLRRLDAARPERPVARQLLERMQ